MSEQRKVSVSVDIDAEISSFEQKLGVLKKTLDSLNGVKGISEVKKSFGSIEGAIERLQEKAARPITSGSGFESMRNQAAVVTAQLNKLERSVEYLQGLSRSQKISFLSDAEKKKIEDGAKAVDDFKKAVKSAKDKTRLLEGATRSLSEALSEQTKKSQELSRAQKNVEQSESQVRILKEQKEAQQTKTRALEDQRKTLTDYLKAYRLYEEAGGDKRAKGNSDVNKGKGLEDLNLPESRKAAKLAMPQGLDIGDIHAVEEAIGLLGEQIRESKKATTDAEVSFRAANTTLQSRKAVLDSVTKAAGDLDDEVKKLQQDFEDDSSAKIKANYNQLRKAAESLGISLDGIPLDYTEENAEKLTSRLKALSDDGIAELDKTLAEATPQIDKMRASLEGVKGKVEDSSEAFQELDEKAKQSNAVTDRIKQFIGLQGAANLAKKALRDAYQTIKELDSAMAEMAVVTEFDIGDYWDQLPEYTKRANELGIAINETYRSTAQYYQQGLNTEQAVAMSTETLKMARIANLEAAESVQYMTSALRGFNMELNQTSAQRINDVYSELAAISATDVTGIATAMSKAASIASSANMEFEATAAFLAQIIETTQEAPETAGTALRISA